mmetsp:Transcript_33705/g.107712  ORF Transcript_33705/g.107712 Transcript_33705/m.107712 type:complete len:399 (-) Transcript_33705:912-2108(-)
MREDSPLKREPPEDFESLKEEQTPRLKRVLPEDFVTKEQTHRARAVVVTAFCLVTVSLVPPASKAAMRHAHSPAQPLLLSTLQLGGSALLFAAASVGLRGDVLGIFWEAFPVGVAFGAKLALMNVGLAGTSTVAHVALQSTDLFWCAAFASCATPSEAATTLLGKGALLGCVVGAALVAVGGFYPVRITAGGPRETTTTQGGGENNKFSLPGALAANLAAPALQGFVVVLLRGSVSKAVAKRPEKSVASVVLDFTAAKLAASAATAGLLAAPFLRWPYARKDLPVVAVSTALVACVQLSFSGMATAMSANSIGVVGTVKFVPQVLCAALAHAATAGWHHALSDIAALQLAGTLLLLASSALWLVSGETTRFPTTTAARTHTVRRRPISRAVDVAAAAV